MRSEAGEHDLVFRLCSSLLFVLELLTDRETKRACIGATASWTAAALRRFGGVKSARRLAQSKTWRHIQQSMERFEIRPDIDIGRCHIECACVFHILRDVQDSEPGNIGPRAGDDDIGIHRTITRRASDVCAVAINGGGMKKMIFHHSLLERNFASDDPKVIRSFGPLDNHEVGGDTGVGVPGNLDCVAAQDLGGKVPGWQQISRERRIHNDSHFGLASQPFVIRDDGGELEFTCRQIRPAVTQRSAGN